MQQGSTCSDSERQQFGSSSESIGPITAGSVEEYYINTFTKMNYYLARTKTSPAPPAAIPEVNGEKEVRFIKSVNDHKFKGERIVMVTNKHMPFMVCSFIPYVRNQKTRYIEILLIFLNVFYFCIC